VKQLAAVVLLAVGWPAAVRGQVASGTTSTGLHYEVSGAGEPIVLIHAFSVDRRMWAPQIALLEPRFKVVRYDLRGHGKSAAPAAPYSQHEDLRSVLDHLGIDRATLVGLSAGAQVATDFALAYPARVSRLVLAGPGLGGYSLPPLPWLSAVFQAAAKGDAPGAAKLWADTPIMALRNDSAAAATVNDLVMSNQQLWTYKANPVQPLAPPAVKRLAEIRCPTLIVVGDADLAHIKEVANLLAAGIPGAKLVTVPRAGHLVTLDAAAAFNEALTGFMASTAARQP
jgi:3-oxoadipate enol-lactonase